MSVDSGCEVVPHLRIVSPPYRAPQRNRILNALEPRILSRFGDHLERVEVRLNAVLYDEATPNRFIYFPETCVLSLINTDDEGATLAVGTFGSDSMIVAPSALSRFVGSLQMVAHIPGLVQRIDTEIFNEIAETTPALRDLLLQNAQMFALHVAQVGTCSTLHRIWERCVRALLTIHDRRAHDSIEITHETLASIVGVRRAAVSEVMQSLKAAGLITYRRGNVLIVDRVGLDAIACSCVQILQRLAFDVRPI